MCPLALSTGNAKPDFESACRGVEDYFYLRNLSRLPKDQVCEKLISEDRANDFPEQKYMLWESLLPLAIQLARAKSEGWKVGDIKFWVENLAYVATLC